MLNKLQNRTLFFGDNLEILREKIPDESFDLIYLDPPFNSDRNYNVIFKEGKQDSPAEVQAFEDSWHWTEKTQQVFEELVGVRKSQTPTNDSIANLMVAVEKLVGHNDMLAYLTMMTVRLIELHRVLKETGSIYLHCDPTASHYLKIALDVIFGKQNFQNEIIWHYRRWTAAANRFQKLHDIILFYTKGDDYTFNPLYTDYTTGSIQRKRQGVLHRFKEGEEPVLVSDREVSEQGVRENDVWHIPFIAPSAKERLGYPTQKPEALLERIIRASTKEGDWVLDPFCGCGTTVSVAERLERNWVGIDITMLAINLIRSRLADQFQNIGIQIFVDGIPKDVAGAKTLFEKDPFEFEYWALDMVNARPAQSKSKEHMRGADKGVDGVIRFAKYIENGKEELGKIVVQVKGGGAQRSHIATLISDAQREGADGGLFITLEKPSAQMKSEAVQAGSFTVKFGSTTMMEFPKIQILTIEELLHGILPRLPMPAESYYKEAKAIEKDFGKYRPTLGV